MDHGVWTWDFQLQVSGGDNGGEFRNCKMEEFANNLGLKIDFGPAYSP